MSLRLHANIRQNTCTHVPATTDKYESLNIADELPMYQNPGISNIEISSVACHSATHYFFDSGALGVELTYLEIDLIGVK